METKQCAKCGLEKPLTEFALNKSRKDGHSSECKECHKIYRDNHYKNNKQYYIDKAAEYKREQLKEFNKLRSTLKCAICGEDRWWVLDFHHIDPSTKEAEVPKLIYAPNKMKEEMEKCIVLCSNCHRDLHYQERIQNKDSGVY